MGAEIRTQTQTGRWPSAWCCALLMSALAADLLTPYLISKGALPAYSRWLSHGGVAVVMASAYVRMMVFDRVPRTVWLIAWLSVTGITVALLRGQSILATLWGWWVMFQFPLVGLYVYLEPQWPSSFARRFRLACTAILILEVTIQVGQYLAGEPPGDNLSGTFGPHGVANLMLLTMFVLCLALGQWLAHGEWKTLVLVLALGSVASVLGEMKLFPFAVLALGVLTISISSITTGRLVKLLPYGVLVGGAVWAFFGLYDAVVVPARKTRALQSFLDLRTIDSYLGSLTPGSGTGVDHGTHYMGRNYALAYGWKTIRGDAATLLFGIGLGARGESRTLATAGIALEEGDRALSTGTSMIVVMQELGLVGMAVLGGFLAWVVVALARDLKGSPPLEGSEVRYALLLFSLLWPLWLWYHKVILLRVPMALYWVSLGWVLGERQRLAGFGEWPVLSKSQSE